MGTTKYIFTDDIFFRNLRYLRAKYYLSLRALAKLSRMSPVWIKMMENNQWTAPLDVTIILRLGQIFGIDTYVLLRQDLSADENL